MMIQTTVGVPMDAMVLNNYFRTLINLFFKILPIKESCLLYTSDAADD